MAEKIGDGYVEVDADVDRDQVRRKAGEVLKEIEKVTKRRNGNFFKWLFTPNPSVLKALEGGLSSVLATPIGMSGIALAGVFAAAFIGALATVLLTAGLGAVFLAAGTFAIFKFNKGVAKAGKHMLDTLKGIAMRATKPLVEPIEGALRLIERAAKRMEPVFKQIFAGLAPSIKPLTQGLIGLVENALPGFLRSLDGINAVFRALGEHLPKLGTAIGDFFAELTKDPALLERVTGNLITFVNGVLKAAGPLLEKLTVLFGAMVNMWRVWSLILKDIDFSSVTSSFDSSAWQQVKNAFSGVWQAIKDVWGALREFAQANTDEEIVTKFGALTEKLKVLWDKLKIFLKEAWNWAWGEIKKIWEAYVEPWLKQKFNEAFDYVAEVVKEKLNKMKRDAVKAVSDMVTDILTWILLLPVRVAAALVTLPIVVVRAIVNAAVGAAREAGRLVSVVVTFIATMPGRIQGALSGVANAVTAPFRGAGSWLYGAGQRLVDGLIAGIRSRTGGVGAAMGAAAAVAARYVPGSPVKEGPLKAFNQGRTGKLLMQMLATGVRSEFPNLRRTFASMPVPALAASFAGIPAPQGVGFHSSQFANSTNDSAAPASNTQIFNISTQEIDPRRHAAELGWELERRM